MNLFIFLRKRISNGVEVNDRPTIYFRIYHEKKVFCTTTKITIPNVKDWDKMLRKVKKSDPNHEEKNIEILKIISYFKRVFNKDDGTLDIETIKRRWFNHIKKPNIEDIKDNLLYNLDLFIAHNQRNGNWAKATDAKYMKVRSLLGKLKLGRLKLRNIDNEFIYDLIGLMKKRKMASNSIDLYLKALKCFLTWCFDNKMIDNNNHIKVKFKNKKVENDIIYLESHELKKFRELEVTGEFEMVKDMFILGCYTGLSHIELARLNSYHIKEGKYISIHRRKTNIPCKIPLMPHAEHIIEKYTRHPKDTLFEKMSLTRYNHIVRILAKRARMRHMVVVYFQSLGEIKEKYVHKWELVSSHTARRTFICNALIQNVQPSIIISITGHVDISSLKPYVGATSRAVYDAIEGLNF